MKLIERTTNWLSRLGMWNTQDGLLQSPSSMNNLGLCSGSAYVRTGWGMLCIGDCGDRSIAKTQPNYTD